MQHDQDREHLNLLAIFYYVLAAITGLFSCFPGLYIVFGIFMLVAPEEFNHGQNTPPPDFFAPLMIGIGSFFILIGWSLAIGMLLTGRYIARRSHWMFCMVMSAIACIFTPFGTILGIFAIIVLNRSSVRQSFDATGEESHI